MELFQKQKGNVTFQKIKIELLGISNYNPRKQRSEKHIKAIAKSIQEKGFDEAFALKVHIEDGKYLAFAGGTRLTACKEIGLLDVPCFVYENFDAHEIWKLAYDDQEQGETQQKFSIVDIWLDYKAQQEKGWTQQKIADSLGIAKSTVNYRIQLANLPDSVLQKMFNSDFIQERSCLELLKCSTVEQFYLPYESCLLEIIENVCQRKANPTAKDFEKEVSAYNDLINTHKESLEKVENKDVFNQMLITKQVRTSAQVRSVLSLILDAQADQAQKEKEAKFKAITEAEQKEQKAKAEQQKMQKRNSIVNNIKLGSCLEVADDCPEGIKLILTDPPYGMDFQSNRRTATKKTDKIDNDANIDEALSLFDATLKSYLPKMQKDSHLLCFCTWKNEFEFRQVIKDNGFQIKGSLIWKKRNHGTGDLFGSFAPKHERIIHAVLGNPTLSQRQPDVLEGGVFLDNPTDHPTPKPIDLLKLLIEAATLENDLVIDPFIGSGATCISALETQRKFFGSEIKENYYYATLNLVDNFLINKL